MAFPFEAIVLGCLICLDGWICRSGFSFSPVSVQFRRSVRSVTIKVRLRFDSILVQCRIGFGLDPTQFRLCSGSISVHFLSGFGSGSAQFRFSSGSVSVQLDQNCETARPHVEWEVQANSDNNTRDAMFRFQSKFNPCLGSHAGAIWKNLLVDL